MNKDLNNYIIQSTREYVIDMLGRDESEEVIQDYTKQIVMIFIQYLEKKLQSNPKLYTKYISMMRTEEGYKEVVKRLQDTDEIVNLYKEFIDEFSR